MGYPNKRVPMTDVHGEPQQGGALPAVIWHDYMAAATEGKPCAALNMNSEGISFKPFYGKFATTGQEAEPVAPAASKPGRHRGARGRGAPRERAKIEIHEAAPPARAPSGPSQPATPPTPAAPPVNQTGGAGPG